MRWRPSTLLIVFATFPDGVPERRWQRIAVVFLWTPVLVGPLTLLTTPHVVMSQFIGISGEAIPNPYFVPWLEWAAPAVQCPRRPVVGGRRARPRRARLPCALRRARGACRTRVMAMTVAAAMVAFATVDVRAGRLGRRVPGLRVDDRHPRRGDPRHPPVRRVRHRAGRSRRARRALVEPAHHGRLRRRGRDARPAARATRSVPCRRSCSRRSSRSCCCPVRSWMQRRLHRALFGDRERQFTMLSELGAQLEQAGDPRELLTRLAEAVRDGLDASWVRIRLVSTDAALAAVPDRRRWRRRRRAGRVVRPRARRRDPRAHRGRAAAPRRVRRRGAHAAAHGRGPGRGIRRERAPDGAARRAARRADAPRASGSSPRRTTSADASNATCTTASSRTSWRRSPGSASPATGCSAGSSRPRSWSSCRTRPGRRSPTCGSSPAASTRPVLSDNGLVAAVESGVARFPIPLEVSADAAVRAERYPDDVETTAYYVVREALANTAKHAQRDARLGRARAAATGTCASRSPTTVAGIGALVARVRVERRPREHPRPGRRAAGHGERLGGAAVGHDRAGRPARGPPRSRRRP